jgi:hypothetical protein
MDSEKRNGRPPKPIEEHTRRVTVSMAPEVHDWLKGTAAGMSKTIDELARAAMKKEERR